MVKEVENIKPFTREQYDQICQNAERVGYVIITKWRKGIKYLRVGCGIAQYREDDIQRFYEYALQNEELDISEELIKHCSFITALERSNNGTL
jgi:hypothetical protein